MALKVISHKTKLDAIGAATRMQGYEARLGFGSTLIRNQTNAPNPNNGNAFLSRNSFSFESLIYFLQNPIRYKHLRILFI